MLTLSELNTFDPSLELKGPASWQGPVLGFCAATDPLPNHLLLIKDKNYWQRLETALPQSDLSSVGLIIEKKFYAQVQDKLPACGAILTCEAVDLAMSFLSRPFYQQKFKDRNSWVDGRQMGTAQIHPSAFIAQGVFIGEGVQVGAFAQIHPGCVLMSHSQVGEDTILYPQVTLYEDVIVGKSCRLHSGVVVGADGFGYNFKNGVHHKVWHTGNVIIEDEVEIGAASTIDRATFSSTKIGFGSKIDNQVQIGHNVQLGRGVILCGQVGVAGSAVIEDFCVLGGKAGVGPGVRIGRGSQVAGVAQVNHDWPAGSVIAGHPAQPLKEWLRGLALVRRLTQERSHSKARPQEDGRHET